MSRNNFRTSKVGFGRGSSIRFGTPQRFSLGACRQVTTVYLPMSITDPPPNLDSVVGPRLTCYPNADQYTDIDRRSPLTEGNYEIKFIPVEEEPKVTVSSDDEESIDTADFIDNMAQSPEMQTDFGRQVDCGMTSVISSRSPPQNRSPQQRPACNYEYGILHPPSAPPLTYNIMTVNELVLSYLRKEDVVITYGPPPRRDTHRICKSNLDVLKLDQCTDQWLDDTVINYYLHLIASRNNAHPEAVPSVYHFDGSFYPLLASTGGIDLVALAADNVNIFNFELLLFPVCVNHHWILVTADTRAKTITAYNSMNQTPVRQITFNIERYLRSEYKRMYNGDNPPYTWARVLNEDSPDIPQQENPFDCGVFILAFAEYLSREQPFDFTQVHMRYFRAKILYECTSGRLINN